MRRARAVVAVALLAVGTAGCGRSLSQALSAAGDLNPNGKLVTTTPAGTKPVPQITWALYRDVNSLDPAFAFDYPENTSTSLLCESLLRQKPDGSLEPGLATLSTLNPTTLVFAINPKATFWDGRPVTPADVVFSLDRQMSAALGGYYAAVFARVRSITQTGQRQVTIALKQPDYWLPGELAAMPGIIIEKAYAQRLGKSYGTAAGGIMCTGDYAFTSWSPSTGVVATANRHYWRGTTPQVDQILLKGVADNNALTAGLETGAIQGTYSSGGIPTLTQLGQSSGVNVYQGPGWASDAMIISASSGAAADPAVREAISLALNRNSLIQDEYKGAALMPKWLANPGVFGYGVATFDRFYQASPALTQNLAKARTLIQLARATGENVTIGTSNAITSIAIEVGAFQQAMESIGLRVTLKSVSAQNFINFFTDPNFRKGVDMFPTSNYGDYADPSALLSTIALSNGTQNYDGYSDPRMTALLNQARSEPDPGKRAALTARAEQLAVQQNVWIPAVAPTQVLILSSKLTGATASFAYMFAPWADSLGGK